MATFHGTLRLAAEPDAVHSATVILVDGRFVLRAAGSEIGDWPLQDLNFSYSGEEIRVRIDGDEALLSMPERGAFAAAVGLDESGADSLPSPAPQSEATTELAPSPEPEDAASALDDAPELEHVDPEPFTVDLAPPPPPAPAPLPSDSAEATPAEASDVAQPSDGPDATTDPMPTPDFSVGMGGDQWAANDPIAAAPEPSFDVGQTESLPSPPAETSAEPSEAAAPSDVSEGNALTDPASTVSAPPQADAPWSPGDPGLPSATDDLGLDDPKTPPPEDLRAPESSLPEDLETPAAPFAGDLATGGVDSGVPLDSDTTPALASDPDSPTPAAESPAAEQSETNDLPVEAAGAAAAVWGVRSQSPTEEAGDTDLPVTPAVTPDDLVAARLAAQRDSTLASAAPLENEDAAAEAEPTTTGPEETAPDEGLGQTPADGGEPDAGASATDPAEAAEMESEPDDGLGRLRKQSAAGYEDAETLRNWIAWGLLVGGLLIGVGAFLTWGDARMFGTDYPVARALAGLAAIASVIGFILGFFMHRRTQGAYVAGTGAVLGLMTLFVYGRAVGLGVGYFLTLLGVLVVAGLSVLAITPAGESHNKRDEN